MRKILNSKLFKNIIIFTFGTVLNKGLNFFLLPVLTYHLTKDDYGHLGFIMSIITITSIYIGLWPGNFIIAKFNELGKEKMSYYMSNIFIIVALTFFVILGILFLSKQMLFVGFEHTTKIIFIILIYTTFMVTFNILNTITQLEKNALKYALMQFLYTSTSLSLALLLIIRFKYGWEGKLYGEISMLSLFAIYTLYYFKKQNYITFNISTKMIKELFNYLFPMTFYVVGIFLLVTIDKVILAKYTDISSVGIYTIAMTMAIIINIVFDSTIRAWEPYFFEKINNKTQQNQNWIIKSVLIYSLFILFSAVIYIFIVPYIFELMINNKFEKSLQYIPYLIVGFSLEGLRKPLSSFLMHKNKVKTLATISLLSAFINIVLNIILIQKNGILGAVYATIISFFILYIMTVFLVFKTCEIRYKPL